jgi:hypothetical protein
LIVRLASSEAWLNKISVEAVAKHEYAIAIRCERDKARLVEQRFNLVHKLGVFNSFRLPTSSGDDPGARQSEFFDGMIEDFLAEGTDLPDDNSGSDE